MFLTILEKFDLPRASDLPKNMMYQLIFAYVLITLPMLNLFPFWIPLLALMTIALKLASIRWCFTVSKWISISLLVIFGALILLNAKVLGKEYTGVAMLFVFASLKILEAREQRDAFLLMLIYLLLIMGALMAQQSPLAFIYLTICFLYNIYIQLRIAQPPELGLSIKHSLKSIMKISLVSLPFVIVLFFLFPRIEPLWQTSGKPQAKTGLSDEMTPNSMTDLVQDGSIAFRVQFTNRKVPKNKDLYWRGPVLADYDGETWRRSANESQVSELKIASNSKINYNIIHDGSTKNWIVPLDMPGEEIKGATLNRNFELRAKEDIVRPTIFSLTSFSRYLMGKISQYERIENTDLPIAIFPKTRQLAQEIRSQSKNDEDFAERLWQYFRDNEFFYDLEPPTGNADIDTFLFDNRSGYCQHYSSAFVFMLRSQGVPARVISGYQGGLMNGVSGEFEVRQLHAHAWTEVYLEGDGWVRYDPTAAVSPDRINNGSPFGAAENTSSIAVGARWENSSAFIRTLGTSVRAMNSFWQNWILNYDASKQQSLWKKLGLGSYKYVAWLIILIALIPISLLIWWLYRKRQARRYGDEIYRAMKPFFRYLDRNSLSISPAQTLRDWLEKNDTKLGSSNVSAEEVVNQYYRLRYHGDRMIITKNLQQAIVLFIQTHQGKKITH